MGILFRRDITRRKVVLSLLLLAMFLPTSAYAYYVLAGLERAWYGAGAVISPEGYILTNHHVVEGADIVVVHMYDENIFEAKIIATLPEFDVAIIKIERKCPAYVPVELVRTPEVGESVVVIGHPEGLPWTVSFGIITGLGRDAPNLGLKGLLQTNAGIAPGSSGGPLIDAYGRLIGVNVCVKTAQGVPLTQFGFAIPVKAVAQWLTTKVTKLPQLNPAENELPLREIATRYIAATVLIEARSRLELAQMLPADILGYSMRSPYVWKKLSEKPKEPEKPEQLSIPPSISIIPEFPRCLAKETFLRGSQLKDSFERLGTVPLEFAYVTGSQEVENGAVFEVHVLIALLSDRAEAAHSSQNIISVDMEGLRIVHKSKLTLANLPVEAYVGFNSGEEIRCVKVLLFGADNYCPALFLPFDRYEEYKGEAAVLRGTISFSVDNLVIAVTLCWYHHILEKPLFSQVDEQVEAAYSLADSCVFLHKQVFRYERRFDWNKGLVEKLTKISESNVKLVCFDTFYQEMQRILNTVLEWVQQAF